MSRSDALTTAVQAVDLPGLMAGMYPESKALPGRAGVYFASWRGNTNSPAVSVSRKGQVWLWSDKATGDGGNAFDFLVKVAGLGRQEAAQHLLELAGLGSEVAAEGVERVHYRPIPVADYRAFGNAAMRAPEAIKGRGFNRRLIDKYQIIPAADRPDDALIPITSPDGVVLQVKRRVHGATKGKYRYEYPGHGGPPWCSLGSRAAGTLFVIEGELNGIIAHASLEEAGETGFGVMGVAGAESALFDGLCHGKHVLVYADDDDAGHKASLRWADEARQQGARSVHKLAGQPSDFCEYANQHGRTALAELINQLRSTSIQLYGALDRMVGTYSVRQLVDSAKRYIGGAIIHPTGIRALDLATGGVRESGIFGVGGLSSMGKSSFMRRILLEHVRGGGIVRLYSPDQSPHAIYRLLASLLSDVGIHEARSANLSANVLNYYGDPAAAAKAWQEAYTYVVVELSQRFQVSEESEIREISKDMERAVDQGVTMFGVDYLQLLEPEGSDQRDGLAAKQLQKVSGALGKPIIAAIQLAKYKFPPNRRNALPLITDIEGSGNYQQASEMVFMVFNEEIYARKYAGPEYQMLGDAPGYARILVRKDKEGEGELDFGATWVGRLAAFKDPLKMSLADERAGLM
jgi:putative DNA primase/helicase